MMSSENSFRQTVEAVAEVLIKEKALQTETQALYRLTCALAMECGVDPERLVAAWVSAGDYCRQFKDLLSQGKGDLPEEEGRH